MSWRTILITTRCKLDYKMGYNMRSVISDKEIQDFVSTVLSHGLHLLMIENQEYSRLKQEKRWVVDGDLCEIG